MRGAQSEPFDHWKIIDGTREARENARAAKAQADAFLSRAACFEKADIGTRHLIARWLTERTDVSTGCKARSQFRISRKRFLGQEAS